MSKSSCLAVVTFRDLGNDERTVAETLLAMQAGVDIIVQAAFSDGNWFGRADVLRKVERASRLGDWSYEVYDCKLARETKASTILQLSLYSCLVKSAQGLLPEFMYVVPPGETYEPEKYRVLDYAAYYRYVKSRLQAVVNADGGAIETYPEPTSHCEICRWQRECDRERRNDDHLSLVAGISRFQRKQFGQWDTGTVAALAGFPIPIAQRPDHGSREGYATENAYRGDADAAGARREVLLHTAAVLVAGTGADVDECPSNASHSARSSELYRSAHVDGR